MTLRAKIAELNAADATVLIPYAGEQHSVAALKALNATLTAEDYALIRKSLGGGKRGRARARELVPLQCASCGCRLTHFEPANRPPYFAATVNNAAHGKWCELDTGEGRADLELEDKGDERAAATAPPAPEPSSASEQPSPRSAVEVGSHAVAELARESASALPMKRAQYVIRAAMAHAADSAPLHVRLAITPGVHDSHDSSDEQTTFVADARALLTLALNRRVPADSQVHFHGEQYAIVSASELHRHDDGELVAVYGRICEAAWSEASARLTLIAAPRTVQIWATAAVPRSLLGVRWDQPIEPPVMRKPVPFIAFGKLKKLAAVCGVPVVRREFVVLLQPLELASTLSRPERTQSVSSVQPSSPRSDESPSLFSDASTSLSSDASSSHPSNETSSLFERSTSSLAEESSPLTSEEASAKHSDDASSPSFDLTSALTSEHEGFLSLEQVSPAAPDESSPATEHESFVPAERASSPELAPALAMPSEANPPPRDLTDELDGLRFSPLSTQPAQFANAKHAILEAFSDDPAALRSTLHSLYEGAAGWLRRAR